MQDYAEPVEVVAAKPPADFLSKASEIVSGWPIPLRSTTCTFWRLAKLSQQSGWSGPTKLPWSIRYGRCVPARAAFRPKAITEE